MCPIFAQTEKVCYNNVIAIPQKNSYQKVYLLIAEFLTESIRENVENCKSFFPFFYPFSQVLTGCGKGIGYCQKVHFLIEA